MEASRNDCQLLRNGVIAIWESGKGQMTIRRLIKSYRPREELSSPKPSIISNRNSNYFEAGTSFSSSAKEGTGRGT